MKIVELNKARNICGGKAQGLYKLIQSNIKVPVGFVIEDSQSFSNEHIHDLEMQLIIMEQNARFLNMWKELEKN